MFCAHDSQSDCFQETLNFAAGCALSRRGQTTHYPVVGKLRIWLQHNMSPIGNRQGSLAY